MINYRANDKFCLRTSRLSFLKPDHLKGYCVNRAQSDPILKYLWAKSILSFSLCILITFISQPCYADGDTSDIWPSLQEQIFGKKIIIENSDFISLEAPVRAEDAALVPITIRIPAEVSHDVKKVTLVIDKNPAPVVAEVEYGPAAGSGERLFSTRVRVDTYTDIHAIAETLDGTLYTTKQYVKAAGGCSAPALKDTDAALANAGKIIIKTLNAQRSDQMLEGQFMIKHPQYSGLQMNQATGFYIPPNFIREIELKRGNEVIFRMMSGMSISEDPNIRFTYEKDEDNRLEVEVKDTNGKVFKGQTLERGS